MKCTLADGTEPMIIDDPVNPDAKPIDRERMDKWWASVDKSKIAIRQTPWHSDDLCSRLLKKARGDA